MLGDKEVRMFVKVERPSYGGDYLHLEATVCYVEYDQQISEWAPRWFTGWGEEKWDGLQVTAQADLKNDGAPYGWRCEYGQCHAVGLQRAEAMVKELRRINRRLEALEQQLARPTDFGQYLVRVGRAVGADAYGFHNPPDHSSGARYKWIGATEVPYEIDWRVEQLRKPFVEVQV